VSWFKVDDHLTFHPKVLSVGNEAIGAWVRLGAYCGGHLTDGAVPAAIALSVCGNKIAAQLVAAGFLEQRDGSYLMHDYLDYNPSAEQVKAARAASAERQARHRQRNGVTNDNSNGVTNTVSNGCPDQPVPSRPDPIPSLPNQPDQIARARVGWLAGLYDGYPRQGDFEKGAHHVQAFTGDDQSAFTNAVHAYAQKVTDEKTEPRYVTTWPKFCERKWRDYTRLPKPRRNGTGMGDVRAPVDKTRKETL
jgi:hypothetical protein